MTDQQHPITPPPELRQLWAQQAQRMDPRDPVAWLEHIATQAARWGADQELEACCEWLDEHLAYENNVTDNLRAARRPKPPSLKAQAIAALTEEQAEMSMVNYKTIRTALDSLPS
jgi:hypothetical protein